MARIDKACMVEVLRRLRAGDNIIYTKFGDGEFQCMSGSAGGNCDGDAYHPWLAQALCRALVSLAGKPNALIGRWQGAEIQQEFDRVADLYGIEVPWAPYHLFTNDDDFAKSSHLHDFVELIARTTSRKKIVVSNALNRKLQLLFRADVLIEIPDRSWSLDYETWRNRLASHVVPNAVILIAGGLCSKVLIDDITNEYDVTFVDLGSGFDMLCRGVNTREWLHSVDEELAYYRDLLPEGW